MQTKFKYKFIPKTLHLQPKLVKKTKLSGSFNFNGQKITHKAINAPAWHWNFNSDHLFWKPVKGLNVAIFSFRL